MSETIYDYLREAIRTALEKDPELKELSTDIPIALEKPKDPAHGDIAANIAFILGKKAKRNPREIAETLMQNFPWNSDYIETPEKLGDAIKGPGFINFRCSGKYRTNALKQILDEKNRYGRFSPNGKSLLLEFVSANPTGPMVVVNARAAAIGDTLARMFEFCGWDVAREYYINDAGNQVRMLGLSVEARYMELYGKDWPFPEEGYHGEYVKELAEAMKVRFGEEAVAWETEKRIEKFAAESLTLNLEKQKDSLSSYGVCFRNWQSEKELHDNGLLNEVREILEKKNLLYDKEGAVWLKTEQYGHNKDEVFYTSKGAPTYLVGDCAYHLHKGKRDFSRYITLWGPDHHGHLSRLEAAIEALGMDRKLFTNLIIQQVNLLRGKEQIKMSKRAGEFITLDDLVSEVGVDAARYFFLMRRLNSHFDFDMELAKKKSDDNPVYYIQYAHARISGVIRHAEEKGIALNECADLNKLDTPQEAALIKKLIRFPDMVSGAVEALEPHRITTYLTELAADFHGFYQNCRVVGDDKELSESRLQLVIATRTIIAAALDLLGVSAPKRM